MSELYRALSLSGWFDSVLRLTLASGGVLLAVLAADMLLARRVSARWRAALYLAVFVRVVLPGSWGSPMGVIGREALPAAQQVVEVQAGEIHASVAPGIAPRVARPWPVALLVQAGVGILLVGA